MKQLSPQRGIALVEALIAVLLLAVGLIGAMGIQARSVGALSEATARSEATMASESLVGIMSNDQLNLSQYVLATGGTASSKLAPWLAETRTVIPGAVVTVAVTPTAGTTHNRVDISIGWVRKNGDPLNTHQLTAHLAGSQ